MSTYPSSPLNHGAVGNDPIRLHVLQDVLPYTCIFEDCSTPFTFYRSVADWLAHMEQQHSGRHWLCYQCSPSEPRIFNDFDDYMLHFKNTKQHVGITTSAQIDILAELNEIPQPLQFTSCPLCSWSELSNMHSFSAATMQDHIADHLFSFAMKSVPPDTKPDMDSDSTSGASSQAMDGDTERYSQPDSLDWLESHSLASDASRLDDIYSGQPDDEPLDIDTKSSVSNVAMSRWRKVLLLSTAIASFLAGGRRIRTKSMCEYCLVISAFFQNLDVKVSYKQFAFHQSRQEIYLHAQLGCSLCKMFVGTAFEGADEIENQEELEGNPEESEAAAYSVIFVGSDMNKRLELWKGEIDTPRKPICEYEIYCTRSK